MDQTEAQTPTGTDSREQRVSRAFVELADSLVDDYDIIELLQRLVGHSVELLAADAAAIMLVDAREQLRVVASSSEDAELMELLAIQAEQGPCLDCVDTGRAVAVADLSEAAARWPRFVASVAARGAFASVHALPLRLRGQAIGVLNLFHHEPGPLPASDLALGQALADVATIGILAEQAIRRGEVVNEQATDRTDQPRDHRTSQRRARPRRSGERGRRLRPTTPLRPRTRPAPRRGSPPTRRHLPTRHRRARRTLRTKLGHQARPPNDDDDPARTLSAAAARSTAGRAAGHNRPHIVRLMRREFSCGHRGDPGQGP